MISTLTWRAMTARDLPAVLSIASEVHPDFPEEAAVFSERLKLHPAGARVLDSGGIPTGYLIAHPWRLGAPPALNSLLGSLPSPADTFYLHDLALLPVARGTGAARAIVEWLAGHARNAGFASLSLVAVKGSAPFWGHLGFQVESGMETFLQTYGEDARFMIRELA